MNKKLIGSILILFLAIFYMPLVKADSNPYVYIKDVTKYKNSDQVVIEVCAENMDGRMVTLGMDVKYNPEKLEFVSAKKGKDLKAEIQLAEDRPNQKRVAIGAVNTSGFETSGTYYTVIFKVKDSSSDIPVELNIREATDSKGNDIKIDTKNGTIKISSETNNEKNEKSPGNQKIETFEKKDINELTTLEEIVTENGNVEVVGYDNLVYETEDNSILEISNDGLMLPNQDGITNVRVKLNGETLGNVKVEVKDGKVLKVTGTDEVLEFVAEATTGTGKSEGTNYSNNNESNSSNNLENENDLDIKEIENDESISTSSELYSSSNNEISQEGKKENNVFMYIVIVVVVIILFLIFFNLYKKRGGKK